MAQPPDTERKPVVDEYHGDQIVDPYRWLEGNDEAVEDWVARQNAYARRYLEGPIREALEPRFEPLAEVADYGTVVARGGRYFQFVERPGDDQPRLTVRGAIEAERRVLVDPNGWEGRSVDWFVPSHDGERVAYVVAEGGSEQYDIHVMAVDAGEVVDTVADAGRTRLEWGPDGLYYVTTGSADAGDQLEKEVRYREPDGSDRKLADHDDPHAWPILHADRTGAMVMASTELSAGTDLYVLEGDAFVPAVTGTDADFAVTLDDGVAYLRTDHDAPRGRVLAQSVDELAAVSVEGYDVVVPEREATLERIAVTGDHLVAHHQRAGRSRLTLYGTDGERRHEIDLPDHRALAGSDVYLSPLQADPDAPECFFRLEGFDAPPGVYRADLETDGTERLDVPAVEGPDLTVSQVRVDSTDGAEVPLFLVHRDDLDPDGDRPTVLDGYGGFRSSYSPSFDRFRLPFLADGGVFAGVCARGGREFGEAWHEAGMREDKQHTFDDFIAAAEYLVEAGYTTPDRLAVTGRSNGGLSVGAVLTQRPDLFGAAVCGVPLLDMLRFPEFLLGESWTPEYGSPADPDDYEVLKAYSPYHNVEDRRYPPVLFTTAESDTRVHPAHARKMTARLQAEGGERIGDSRASSDEPRESDGGPFLLRTYADTGHGVGKPTWLEVEEALDEWAFLYDRLGIDP